MKPFEDELPIQLSDPHELRKLVLELLKNRMRSFVVGVSEQGIVLSGECSSFHAKQLAQEIVSQHCRLRIIANNIVVRYSCEIRLESDDSRG